ncbi:hypothetical protein ACTXT7_007917 [Hymenolepis weldensis]
MNFSTSTKDPKDYMKSVDENFTTWYAQHRDIYKNIMADLPHASRITMLLREFNRIENYLCSFYFQPMDPADLNYEKMISFVNRLCTSFRFVSLEENQFRCLIFILGLLPPCHAEIRLRNLSLLDKKPDVKKSRRRPESAVGLGPTSHPTLIRRMSEAVTLQMLILQRTSSSSRLPYRRRHYQNCNDNGHKEDFYRESSTNSSTGQNPNNKRALTQTRQSHVAKIPQPSIHIQSPKPDSPRTQL